MLPTTLGGQPVLNGPHVVHTAVRPYRLAYIIPMGDIHTVRNTIVSCCLQWGGMRHLILPSAEGGELDSRWLDVAVNHAPDLIVDAAGVNETINEYLEENALRRHRWQNNNRTLYINGTLIYGAIRADLTSAGVSEYPESHLVLNPGISTSHDLSLLAAARFGVLDEDQAIEQLRLHGWSSDSRLAQLVNLVDIELEDQLDAILGSIPRVSPEKTGSGTFHTVDLPRLTDTGLITKSPSYVLGDLPIPREKYDRAFLNSIVVTGSPDSVSDLALFWNIRARRTRCYPFPLWIPLEFLDADEGQRVVEYALAVERVKGGKRPIPPIKLHIVSTSTPTELLVSRLRERYPEAEFEGEYYGDYLAKRTLQYIATADREAQFSDGAARISLLQPKLLDELGRGDRLAYDLAIEEATLPTTGRVYKLGTLGSVSMSLRVDSDGIFTDFASISDWPTMVRVPSPSGENLLRHLFDKAGFKIRRSDKAGIVAGVAKLFNSQNIEQLINSQIVYRLLRRLSETRGGGSSGSPRAFYAERETMTFDGIKHFIGDVISQRQVSLLLQLLVQSRVLLRGDEIKCPICQLRRWYPVDRLTEIWVCDGCGERSAVPLRVNATVWRFRVNELVATGLDQGAITPINTMLRMQWDSVRDRRSLLGCSPGLVVVPTDGLASESEIDIVGIEDGQLVICECKEAGTYFNDDELQYLLQLADKLPVSKLVLATATDFDSSLRQRAEFSNLVVEWWEGKDLFETVGVWPEGANDTQDIATREASYLTNVMNQSILSDPTDV